MRVSVLTACTLSAFLVWEIGRQVGYSSGVASIQVQPEPHQADPSSPTAEADAIEDLLTAAVEQPISASEAFWAERVQQRSLTNPPVTVDRNYLTPNPAGAPALPTLRQPLPPPAPTAVSAADLPIDQIVAQSLALAPHDIQAPPPPPVVNRVTQSVGNQSVENVAPPPRRPEVAPPPRLPEVSPASPFAEPVAASDAPPSTLRTLVAANFHSPVPVAEPIAPEEVALLETSVESEPDQGSGVRPQVRSQGQETKERLKEAQAEGFNLEATLETIRAEAAVPASSPIAPPAVQPKSESSPTSGDHIVAGATLDAIAVDAVDQAQVDLTADAEVDDLFALIDAAEQDITESLTQYVADRVSGRVPVPPDPQRLLLAQVPGPATMPTSTPAAMPMPTPATTIDATYTLGPGDRVRLDVFRVPEYSGEHQVLVDGSLSLPLIGNVSVDGLTIQQASAEISERYAPLLRRPIITLSLLQARPLQIAIAGEVNRPGSYSLDIANNAQFPSLVQAIQSAGGVTQAADLHQVQVQRPRRSGAPQLITVDLWELLQTGNLQQDIALRDGDSIVIPTATNPSLMETNQLAAASFAATTSTPRNVAIVGEVFRPGAYQLTPEENGTGQPTVTQAIQVAGGIKPMADVRHIQVRRSTRNGQPQVFDIDLWQLLQEGDLRQDMILQEGDTVMIPTATALSPEEATQIAAASFSPSTIQVNIVGEVEKPGVIQVGPNVPLNQAILAAGGFNQRANKGSVELVRLNPDGTVSRRSIDVDLASGLSEDSNPPLRHNDVIIVGRSGLASVTDGLGAILNPILRLLPFRFLF